MASCNICGKIIESSCPKALIGRRSFSQGAGNGRAWVGKAPTTHYASTFLLLSVGVCQECASKEKKRRLITNLVAVGVSISYFFLFFIFKVITIDAPNSSADIIPENIMRILRLPLLIILVYMIILAIHSIYLLVVDFIRLRDNDKASDTTVLSHYLRTNKIPKSDIMAVSGKANGEKIDDVNVKDTMSVTDPYTELTYIYDLKLYSEETINLIGKINDKTYCYHKFGRMGLNRINLAYDKRPLNQDKAHLDAMALFEKIGVKIEKS